MLGTKVLRIPIIEREPARLNLYHNAVTRQKHVIGSGKNKLVSERGVGRDWFRIGKTFPITAAKNVHTDCELIPAHFGLAGDLVSKRVNQLNNPITVRATGGGDKIHDRRPADAKRFA